ncbi:MAG: hypothetical protein FWD79_05695 [Desulfobulbus sp.]|nr:hypothetical protein [Desulfobulbus sp.]
MTMIRVKAAPGQRCPMEHNPREYITDDPAGIEVAESAYILRLIKDGSLVVVTPKKAKGGA